MGFLFGGGKSAPPPPPPPPAPPPNPPSYASAAAAPGRRASPVGGLASTILTSPTGATEFASTGKKQLLGGTA
jgi:hypothetical protein